MAEAGHNSGINASHLKAFVERIERLEEEKASLLTDIKEIYLEAKGNGFDAKVLRKLVAMRARDSEKLKEEHAILDLYCGALGMDVFS